MTQMNEAAVRLGLALYRRTAREGSEFYNVYDLIFDENEGLRHAVLNSGDAGFWNLQQDAARILDGSGIAQVYRKDVPSSGVQEFLLKITPLGHSLYSLAHIGTDFELDDIDGIEPADVVSVLNDETQSQAIAEDLRKIDKSLNDLCLSNHQRVTINCYVTMLITICEMPERDVKLFWTILERLNQFSGVASLVVALLAMRLAR